MSTEIHDTSDKVYIILGNQKSGTSFLSKALYEQGVKMTSLDNTSFKRHFEDEELLDLNKEILREAGGNWRNVPSVNEIAKVNVKNKIAAMLIRVKTSLWGWKDPRTALTIDHYLPHFKDDDVYLVCIFRKPERVRKAIERDKGEGGDVVDEYNRRILDAVRRFVGL